MPQRSRAGCITVWLFQEWDRKVVGNVNIHSGIKLNNPEQTDGEF